MNIHDFLLLLKNVKQNGANSWTALCPAHKDTENSIAVSEGDDGRILVNCFAGCKTDEVLASLGLKMDDLFVKTDKIAGGRDSLKNAPISASPPTSSITAPAITITDLARDKALPLKFLEFYCEQIPFGVKITYKTMDGKPASRQRLRIALTAKDGSRWTRGQGSPILYGVWRVGRMAKEEHKGIERKRIGAGGESLELDDKISLLLVEGESDAWTAWHHKIAALGVPGADMAGKILKSYVEPFERIYIWQEPDDAGKVFVRGVTERLAELCYEGECAVVCGPVTGDINNSRQIKDLNDLHKKFTNPDLFKAEYQKILTVAQPVDLSKIVIASRETAATLSSTALSSFPDIATAPPSEFFNPALTFRNLTDMGNADRLTALFGEELLYCYPWNAWLIWDGKRWKRDESGEIDRRAEATVRSIYAEAAHETDRERRFELAKHAKQSEAASKIRAMLDRAKNRVPVMPDQLDADPMLFNVQNGIIDLRTGKLRDHDRKSMMTKISPAKYVGRERGALESGGLDGYGFDLKTTAPTWHKFLERVTDSDQSLMSFLQRAAGYALTGDTSEHCLFFLHGDGRNGKSVFLNVLEHVLGDYGAAARPDVLMAKRYGEGIPNEIAALAGVRYVSTTETGSGKRFAEAMLKQYTGGDTISARFLHAEFFTFTPQFKIFLASNNKPIIRGQDTAIWERIYLIPFTVYISPEERDKQLTQKLKKEADGILAWAVEGCLMWQYGDELWCESGGRDGVGPGLNPPAAVRAATEEYRAEMDVLGDFIEDRCVLQLEARTKNADLWRAYMDWCSDNKERYPLTRRDFRAALERRGLEQKRKRSRYYLGIGLVEDGCGLQASLEGNYDDDEDTDSDLEGVRGGGKSEKPLYGGQNDTFDDDRPY